MNFMLQLQQTGIAAGKQPIVSFFSDFAWNVHFFSWSIFHTPLSQFVKLLSTYPLRFVETSDPTGILSWSLTCYPFWDSHHTKYNLSSYYLALSSIKTDGSYSLLYPPDQPFQVLNTHGILYLKQKSENSRP